MHVGPLGCAGAGVLQLLECCRHNAWTGESSTRRNNLLLNGLTSAALNARFWGAPPACLANLDMHDGCFAVELAACLNRLTAECRRPKFVIGDPDGGRVREAWSPGEAAIIVGNNLRISRDRLPSLCLCWRALRGLYGSERALQLLRLEKRRHVDSNVQTM